MEKYLINPNQRIATISKDIYGHFSEHLGRCIYDGIFVGKDSKIPNVNGMRRFSLECAGYTNNDISLTGEMLGNITFILIVKLA